MKKMILLVVTLLLFPLSACEPYASAELAPTTASAVDTLSRDNQTEFHDSICVDISTQEDGFYSLMSDVEIHYYQGDIGYISINNPTLLAFQVSSEYNGGVWLLDMSEGQHVLNELTDAVTSLRAAGEHELAEKIENVIEILSRSGPFTRAST